MAVSSVIRPFEVFVPVAVEDAPAQHRRFERNDATTTIYPKLPGGGSCRVVIIRRSISIVTPGHKPTVLHICRNAGKWSYRIDYSRKSRTTSMRLQKLIDEAVRMQVPAADLRWLLTGND